MKALAAPPRAGGYISAPETVAAAKNAGLSVCDYVERLWCIEGTTASVIDRLRRLGAITAATKSVVEIGPGTGRYIEHTLKHSQPQRYQIYEVDDGWSSWLAKTYPVEACPADGRSLKSTHSSSCDLVHAYGVFVYLPFFTSYRYFKEIARVAAPEAFVAFDIISERCLDSETAEKCIEGGHEFFCFLSSAYVRQFFETNGFRFVDNFILRYPVHQSEFLVFSRSS
jgi:hypothetical protein